MPALSWGQIGSRAGIGETERIMLGLSFITCPKIALNQEDISVCNVRRGEQQTVEGEGIRGWSRARAADLALHVRRCAATWVTCAWAAARTQGTAEAGARPTAATLIKELENNVRRAMDEKRIAYDRVHYALGMKRRELEALKLELRDLAKVRGAPWPARAVLLP